VADNHLLFGLLEEQNFLNEPIMGMKDFGFNATCTNRPIMWLNIKQ
jgi:hypothetical protein